MKQVLAVITLSLGLLPAHAFAWGDEGHRIVCQIALANLSPAGEKLLKSIAADLKHVTDPFDFCPACKGDHPDDGRFLSFPEGCLWADESREDTFKGTSEYHFINVVPPGATTLDLVRDCAALDCVVVAVQRYARYVARAPSGDRERERRVLSFRFLGHFVGDLHQPLHVGFAGDAGGNFIDVNWDTGTKAEGIELRSLHSVWDTSILKRAKITQLNAKALNAAITSAERKEWQTFDIAEWAEESFALALSHAYRQPGGAAVIDGTKLSDKYFDAARPVVVERLKQAGIRLAHLINSAAAGTLPANLLQLTEP